jgi:hypothetical protein
MTKLISAEIEQDQLKMLQDRVNALTSQVEFLMEQLKVVNERLAANEEVADLQVVYTRRVAQCAGVIPWN